MFFQIKYVHSLKKKQFVKTDGWLSLASPFLSELPFPLIANFCLILNLLSLSNEKVLRCSGSSAAAISKKFATKLLPTIYFMISYFRNVEIKKKDIP